MSPPHQEALYGELWNQGLDGLKKYHLINKIEPMDRALKELGAVVWLTGVRRAQSSTRENFQIVMLQNKVLKVAPIVDWNDGDVAQYLQANGLPLHPLGNDGYVSIGDRHTSKKLEPGMNPEETRFHGLKRECGLHESSKISGYHL
jgi:phosphoadenosine phosphosulfate reductase